MNLVRIKEYRTEIYTGNTIDTINMYTFILMLAIRMYTIELGKTSKTEIFLYLFLLYFLFCHNSFYLYINQVIPWLYCF